MDMMEGNVTPSCIHALNCTTDLMQGDRTVENIAWRHVAQQLICFTSTTGHVKEFYSVHYRTLQCTLQNSFTGHTIELFHMTCEIVLQCTPQIYERDPRPRIPPRVMVSSAMGFKLGVFGFLPTTHTKTNTSMIFAHRAVFQACLSSRSKCNRCRGHTHLMNHRYFDYGKTRRLPI